MNGEGYFIGVWIVGVLTFFSIWIYAFVAWGFLVGLAIGWLPALIGGVIAGFLWPLAIIILLVLIVLVFMA